METLKVVRCNVPNPTDNSKGLVGFAYEQSEGIYLVRTIFGATLMLKEEINAFFYEVYKLNSNTIKQWEKMLKG